MTRCASSTPWRLVPDTQAHTHDGQRQVLHDRPDIRAQLTGSSANANQRFKNETRDGFNDCQMRGGHPTAANGPRQVMTTWLATMRAPFSHAASANAALQAIPAGRLNICRTRLDGSNSSADRRYPCVDVPSSASNPSRSSSRQRRRSSTGGTSGFCRSVA